MGAWSRLASACAPAACRACESAISDRLLRDRNRGATRLESRRNTFAAARCCREQNGDMFRLWLAFSGRDPRESPRLPPEMLPTGVSPRAALHTGTSSSGDSEAARMHTGAHVYHGKRWMTYGALIYAVMFVVGWIFVGQLQQPTSTGWQCTNNGKPFVDTYPGAPWRTSQTSNPRLLLADKRMRVELHDVRGEDGKLYTDWIWMDVTDQVNVVPYILSPPPASSSSSDSAAAPVNKYEHGRFRLFRQNKYGMVGSSLAVLGGAIEMSRNEPPLAAAQRELSEELSLSSRADSDWIDLGTYRVNVNRGHGYVSCFLLVDPLETRREEEEFHVDELERQATVDLTYTELEQAVRTHEFKEIKWQATASLALMEVRRLIEEEQRRIDSSEGGAETRQPVVEVAEDRSHQQRGRTRAASPQRTQVVQQAEAEDEQPMQTSE